jgi:hypothetical protein
LGIAITITTMLLANDSFVDERACLQRLLFVIAACPKGLKVFKVQIIQRSGKL